MGPAVPLRHKMAENSSLTPPQLKAIKALLSSRTIGAAATAAGVAERTIYRYLDDDVFRARLRAAQNMAIDAAVSLLSGEARAAAATLAEIHRDKDVPAAVRVQAARAVLVENLKIREQHDLAERIERLEARLS